METKEVNADRELLKALAQDGLFADGFLQWLDRYGVNVATIDGLTDDRKLNLAYAVRCQVEPFE